VSWVWNLLSKPDQRAVVPREPSRRDQLGNGDTAQSGQDLDAEHFRVRALPGPLAHGGLVGRVFPPSQPCRLAAVRRVALFGAELRQHFRRPLTTCRRLRPEALLAVLVAETAAMVSERRSALPAGAGQLRELPGGAALSTIRRALIPGALPVVTCQGREGRLRRPRMLSERVR